MIVPGDRAPSEFFKAPATTEEKWKEGMRLAASALDNAGYWRETNDSKQKGNKFGEMLLEARWGDAETGDQFKLQRFGERDYRDAPRTKLLYKLYVYYGVDLGLSADVSEEDIAYSFYDNMSTLKILSDKSSIPIADFCRASDEEPKSHYDDIYQYLTTAATASFVGLSPLRHEKSGNLVDHRSFAGIVLAEAMSQGESYIKKTHGHNSDPYDEADKAVKKMTSFVSRIRRRAFRGTDSYTSSDTHPGNWRLDREKLTELLARHIRLTSSLASEADSTDKTK